MKKLLFFSTLLILCFFCFACSGEVPINERPMYGGISPTPEEQEIHDKFIKEVIAETGSREAAFERGIELASYYIHKGDLKSAMRRANQAWLLDPDNAEVYYMLGSITARQGKTDETISLYKKALELNPKYAMVMCNLGREYYNKAYKYYQKRQEDKKKEYLDKALKLYEEASQIATDKGDLSYTYYQWAVSLEFSGNYGEAWKKVKLSRKYGGEFIEPGFVRELSRYMPEP